MVRTDVDVLSGIALRLPEGRPGNLHEAAKAVTTEYQASVRWKKLRCRTVIPLPGSGGESIFILEVAQSLDFDWTWEGSTAFSPRDPAAFSGGDPDDATAAWSGEVGVPVVADRAYDSDPLRQQLADDGFILVAPHRKNRTKPRTADGRRLRRYKRRYVVERSFAWLHSYRRVVTRYERRVDLYDGFVHLACAFICLNRLVK